MNCIGLDRGAARNRCARRATGPPDGYALLLIMFFLALLLVTISVATPNILIQGRRDKEEEMIWRGKQYVRGIRLFHNKTHHFPTQLEDLYNPKTGIRYLRQAYKDPMNSTDGSWRLIYVGPDGRLMGSLRKKRNAFLWAQPAPGFASALASPPPSPSSTLGGPTNPSSPGSSLLNPTSSDSASPQSIAAPLADSPTMGANAIVGVGSKIDKQSIGMLDGEKNYLYFEFVWDGSESF